MKNELTLQETQQCALNVLTKFDSICTDQKFKYWLTYGTLIGAIRHNGFIPWDDDIDVMMPRNDFDKFVEYAKKHENLLYPFKLHDRSNTKNYWYGIPRFSDMTYKYIITDKHEKPFDIGVFIDIYPLDYVGDTIQDAKNVITWCKKMNRKYDWYINDRSQGGHLRSTAKSVLHKVIRTKYGNNFDKEIDVIISEKLKKMDTGENKYLSPAAWSNDYVILEKDKMMNFETVKHRFEDKEFSIPRAYDYLLSITHGDYMTLPPESKRHPTHNYVIKLR